MSEKKQQITAPPILHKNTGYQDTLALDRLNKELEEARDQVAALNKELDQRFTEIATLTRLLLDKDQYLDQLSNDLNNKNDQLNQLIAKTDEHLSQIAGFTAQLADIDRLTDSIELKNTQNNDLISKIEFLQISSSDLQIALDDKNRQIEALQNLRDTLTATLELKNQAFDELSGQLTARDAEVAYLKSELGAIYQSTSWRVTTPLRYIKKLLRFTAQ
jgi:chromosome segregation ATPase